ncbi:MAG: ATP-binding protein [Oscillospiraceae bacterium]|nr:ATP-binding protein [Oscillospiraceae bacterium]
MKAFINRHDDLTFLQNQYDSLDASLVILYGRRRVGKTSLISEFGKDKNILYFLATEESESINQSNFKNLVADYTDNQLLKVADVDSWEIIFNTLAKHQTAYRKLIVIDEFQYLGKSNPAFLSIFQKIWESLKKENVMVVLCGSLISMMEAQTLAYDSPLYGRRTGQIKLKPIVFKYYHEFYDNNKHDLLEYYSVTGGVPKYIELFYEEVDIWTAIEKNILTTRSFLYEEPYFLLNQEVSEIGSYFSLLRTIAAGNHKLNAIAANIGVKQTSLTRYLRTLIDLDIIEREVPITDEYPEKSKRGLYKIRDNFLEFWFKFVYPMQGAIEAGHIGQVVEKIREGFIMRHVSYVYEDVCQQVFWSLPEKMSLPFKFNKVGRWWGNNTEIDIVALDSMGTDIIFGECKYTNEPMDLDVFYRLIEKKDAVVWKNNTRQEYFVFFSKSGYTQQMKSFAHDRSDVFLM